MARAKQSVALTSLPVEILLLIAGFISPADAACLALSNRWLMSLFAPGGPLKRRLPRGQPGDMTTERAIFLNRFSHDKPEYFLCCICSQLHLWRTFPLPSSWMFSKCFDLNYDDDRYPVSLFSMPYLLWPRSTQYRLHFTHLQLVMRRFYHGPEYGLSAQSLFYIEVTTCPCEESVFALTQEISASRPEKNTPSQMKTCLTSFEARICPAPPSLCLRIQCWSVVSRQNASMLLSGKDYVFGCGHVVFDKPSQKGPIRSHISACLSGSSKAAEYGKCTKCNTEWHIEVRDFGTEEVSLVLTRWVDLGPGITPQDPRWRCHMEILSTVEVAAEDIVASPRQRFESSLAEGGQRGAFSEQELYFRNASLLTGKKYVRLLERTPLGWCLRPDSRRHHSSGCVLL